MTLCLTSDVTQVNIVARMVTPEHLEMCFDLNSQAKKFLRLLGLVLAGQRRRHDQAPLTDQWTLLRVVLLRGRQQRVYVWARQTSRPPQQSV